VNTWGSNYPVAAHPGGYEYPWETKIYENCSAAPKGAAEDPPEDPDPAEDPAEDA